MCLSDSWNDLCIQVSYPSHMTGTVSQLTKSEMQEYAIYMSPYKIKWTGFVEYVKLFSSNSYFCHSFHSMKFSFGFRRLLDIYKKLLFLF